MIGYYMDPTYGLVLIGAVICMLASAKMNGTFHKYRRIGSMSGYTGAEAARRILMSAGIPEVRVASVRGNLTDHYNPADNTVYLSDSVYSSNSIAAIGVAAHECGHAIQHAENYAPISIRGALVPVANIGSSLSWPIFLAGLFFSIPTLVNLGIILFTAALAFQIVTLPVEFNASARALKILDKMGILSPQENIGARKVLTAAALTYVAGVLSTLLQLLRLLILAGGRDRD